MSRAESYVVEGEGRGEDPCGDLPPSYSTQSRGALVARARQARRHLPRPPGSLVPLPSSLTGGASWACAHRRCCSDSPSTGRCRPSPSGRDPASKPSPACSSSRKRAAPRARGRPGRWLAPLVAPSCRIRSLCRRNHHAVRYSARHLPSRSGSALNSGIKRCSLISSPVMSSCCCKTLPKRGAGGRESDELA